MKKYKRQNCQNIIRATITNSCGQVITLVGRHAFEWSVVKEASGKIIITTYPNRKEAKEEFKKLSK